MTPIFAFLGDVRMVAGEPERGDLRPWLRARERSPFSWTCPYCRVPCESEKDDLEIGVTGRQEDIFTSCQRCGWWSFQTEQESLDGRPFHFSAAAILKKFSPSSPNVPVEPLVEYIQKRPNAIHDVHPAKLEEIVGAIYSEVLGYKVEYCSYGRPDRGIDLIVMRIADGELVAIQVKRNKNPIELGQIHQFYGAVVDGGRREGVFVAAGEFRRGALATAERLYTRTGLRIDLVDGKRLLEFVGVMNPSKKIMRAIDCPHWKAIGYWNAYR